MYPHELFLGLGFYEIFVAIALVLALFLADKLSVRRKYSVKLQRHFILCFILAVGVGYLGAVLMQGLYDFIQTGEFSLASGMTFYGGLVVGAATFILYWFFGARFLGVTEEAKAKFKDMADIAACVIPLVHGIGRLGCLFAGCCHGSLTDAWYGTVQYNVVVDGVYYESAKVVPVQLFEALFLFALAAGLFALFFRHDKRMETRFPLLPLYVVAYGVWRFCMEYARADDRGQTVISFLSPSQLVAIILVAVGVAYFALWHKFRYSKDKELAVLKQGDNLEKKGADGAKK